MTSCASQKKLQAEAPFVLGAASSQDWIGGLESSGKGTKVKIDISEMDTNAIELQHIFYKGKMTPLTMETLDGKQYAMANISKKTQVPDDIIMDADPKNEIGNKPPKGNLKKEEPFPFELNPDEAVISYKEGDKTKYFKISGIKKKQPQIYQSTGPKQ